MRIIHFIFIALMALLTGCATQKPLTKQQAYPQMYSEKPLSILVFPPINLTTAAEAKEYFSATVAEPLTLKGYYIFPIEVVTEILKAEGFPDTELLTSVPPAKFKENFGADAVMYISIDSWNTSYAVIAGSVTVGLTFTMKSTTTGETLWTYKNALAVDTSGRNSGGGAIGLLIGVVATAIKTAMTDYVPIARRLNYIATTSLPAGKYHSNYGKDMEERAVMLIH